MEDSFRPDYELLELEDKADWDAARANYKKLVNIWHPDRYIERPREREHAQQRFIQLTKSFNSLRAFYRENERLPYQRVVVRPSVAPSTTQAVHPTSAEIQESRILTPRRSNNALISKAAMHRTLWLSSALMMMLGALALFYVMDRNAKQLAIENAREVLRQTQPSEFMPTAAEIKKQSSTGAFIERENGKLGDQLMKDVFR